MLFLSRDAAVRESEESAPVVSRARKVAPRIIPGSAPEGPRRASENRTTHSAAIMLAGYIEKITGVPCVVGEPKKPGVLLPNGSFEAAALADKQRWPSLSGDWRVYHNREKPRAAVTLDRKDVHGGKACVTVRGANGSTISGVLARTVIEQGKQYRLSLWYRTRPKTDGTVLVAIPHIRPALRVRLPVAEKWTRHEILFKGHQPKGNWLTLILGLTGATQADSQVWIDDVALQKVDDKPKPATAPVVQRIFVGAAGDPVNAFPALKDANSHGFVIVRKGDDLHIAGRSAAGTRFGVGFFLMNYAGLRIVMPGEIGEVYAKRDAIEAPRELYLLNPGPDYHLRIWSQPDCDATTWLSDSGATQRYQFHHNMWRIYSPKRFGKTHPEYYPMRSGRRVIPPASEKSRWQPPFSLPAAVQRACDYADETFSADPLMESISLTVNDGGGFTAVDLKKAREEEGGSFSNVYYKYVNHVARHVKKRWPGKHVACIAYAAVEPPPDFPLEDNVIVFFMNEAKVELEKWRTKAKHFGVYQWLYGKWWLTPNHWPHAMQEYLKWFRDTGGMLFKAEIYGNWAHDGAKTWALCNLLWNVDCNIDTVLTDYYEHAYGREAAPAMARYYDRAEQVYARRRKGNRYVFSYDNTFDKEAGYSWRPGDRQFRDMTQEDVDVMSAALAEAQERVQGEANRKRLQFTVTAFEVARRCFREYGLYKQIAKAPLKTRADLREAIKRSAELSAHIQERHRFCTERIDPTWPLHAMAYYFKKKPGREIPKNLDWPNLDVAWRLDWDGFILDALLGSVSRTMLATLAEDPNPTRASVEKLLNTLVPASKDPLMTRVRRYSSKYYFARKVATAPKADGILDDACWRKAQVETGFHALRSGDAAQHKSEFMMAYDDANLYLAYRGYQDTSKLVTYAAVRDDKLWTDDSMEFVAHQADAKGRQFYHFIVNSKGQIFDWMKGSRKFDTTARIAAKVYPDHYVIECAIPFGELKKVGVIPHARFVKMNVMRNYNGQERLHDPCIVSSWYFTRGSNLDVRSRGWLYFVP